MLERCGGREVQTLFDCPTSASVGEYLTLYSIDWKEVKVFD